MQRRHSLKNIPTEVIRAFLTIVELGSFTKAAERLDLTQPAISAQIKRLENLLGGEVLEPGSRVRLTHRGELVAKFAQRMVDTNDQIMSLAGPQSGRHYRISLPNGISQNLLVDIVKRLSSGRFRKSVQFCAGNTAFATRSLRSGFLDFAFIANRDGSVPNPVCEWTEEMYWLRSPDLVLSQDAPVPLVSFHGSMSDEFGIKALERIQRRYIVAFSSSELNLRLAAVVAGVGVMACMARAVQGELNVMRDPTLPKLDPVRSGIYAREGLDIRRAKPIIKVLEASFRAYATYDAAQISGYRKAKARRRRHSA